MFDSRHPHRLRLTTAGHRHGHGFGRGYRGGLAPVQFAIRPDRHWAIQLLLLAWRWRTELILTTAVLLVWAKLGDYLPGWPALATLAAAVAVLFTIPPTRRLLTARLWCLISRHRLRVCLVALRESNYLGRLPWILTTRPTPVGERLLIWLRPGFAPADITAKADAIAVACWAREARIEPARRFKAAITVHIIRRDPLTARTRSGDPVVITNPLTKLADAARATGHLIARTRASRAHRHTSAFAGRLHGDGPA